VIIRDATAGDLEPWLAMRCALWPDEDAEDLREHCQRHFGASGGREVVLIACDKDRAIGMIELSLRDYAEGCDTSPVPFIEGWFVAEDCRRRGVGAALVRAAEVWAGERGHSEIGSDTQLWNTASQGAHVALGFEEVERIVCFRKGLG